MIHKLDQMLPHMKRILILLFGIWMSNTYAQKQDILVVGHSLSDAIPEMLKSFGEDQGPEIDYTYTQIIGSPLHYQWSCLRNPSNWPGNFPDGKIYPFYHPDHGLPSGQFEHLILNEGVPRIDNQWGIEETKRFVDSFYVFATEYRSDIAIYLSELWHCLDSGTPTGCHYDEDSNPWRQRLDDDLPMWEKAVDYLNDKYNPNPPMTLIPSGQAMATLYDSIEAGAFPGASSIDQFFDDRIHGNDTVRYLVACVNYAAVTGRSPVGLTNEPKKWWGGSFGFIPEDMANKLQTIAWQTVCSYPHNDISCTTGTDDLNEIFGHIDYDQITSTITVQADKNAWIRVIDVHGRNLLESPLEPGSSQFEITLKSGAYWIALTSGKSRIVQPIIRL